MSQTCSLTPNVSLKLHLITFILLYKLSFCHYNKLVISICPLVVVRRSNSLCKQVPCFWCRTLNPLTSWWHLSTLWSRGSRHSRRSLGARRSGSVLRALIQKKTTTHRCLGFLGVQDQTPCTLKRSNSPSPSPQHWTQGQRKHTNSCTAEAQPINAHRWRNRRRLDDTEF